MITSNKKKILHHGHAYQSEDSDSKTSAQITG